MPQRSEMMNEIRYAERLCQRTARLYRRLEWAGVFLSVASGSAMLTALMGSVPPSVSITGGVLFAIFGAAFIATRPADKAAVNEVDAKRYAALRAKAASMDDAALRSAIDEHRVGDVAEVENLRNVAYNDVAIEMGQPTYCIRLTLPQRVLATLA